MNRTKTFFVIILLIFLVAVVGGSALAADREQRVQFTAPVLVANTSFLNVRTGPGAQYGVLITVVGGTELPVLAVANDFVWYQVSTVVGTGWVNVEFTIPRGDFSNVPVIRLSDLVGFVVPTPVFGGVVPTAGAPVSGAPAAPVTSTSCFATTATLLSASLNMLAQPAANATVIGLIFNQGFNTDYAVVGQAAGFVQIVVPGIGTGWVDATQVFLRPSGAVGLTVIVLLDQLFITSAPYSAAQPLVIPAGTEAWIVGTAASTYQIRTINGDVVTVDIGKTRIRTEASSDQAPDTSCTAPGGAAAVPGATPVPGVPAAPVGPTIAGARVVVNTGFLNVRSGPGSQYSVVTTVNGGTELAVAGVIEDAAWFLVSGTFGQGWVDSEFVVFRGSIDAVPVINYSAITTGSLARPVAVVATAVTLYAAPGTNFGTIGTLPGPTEVSVVARTADNTWLQVSSPLGFGWVLGSQVTVRGDLSLVPVVG